MKSRYVLLILTGVLTVSAHGVGLASSRAAKPAIPSFLIKKASYQENWQRYPSPDVILNKLRQDFPLADLVFNEQCESLNKDNRALLGDSQPMTGRPAVDSPNSAFINWYGSCVATLIQSEGTKVNGQASLEGYASLNGKTALDMCKASFDRKAVKEQAEFQDQRKRFEIYTEAVKKRELQIQAKGRKPGQPLPALPDYASEPVPLVPTEFNPSYCMWSDLQPGEKINVINSFLERYIGPEDVIVDLDLAGSENELSTTVRDYVDKFVSTPDDKFNFLLYATPGADSLDTARAVMLVKLLIHLEDITRY